MSKKIVMAVAAILSVTAGNCPAGCCTKSPDLQCQKITKPDPVDAILKKLNQKTAELESYQAQIEYLFSQPLFKSETMRKGVLYYAKSGQKSKLRINFQILRQDDEKEQKHIEHYIFDGVWLTVIDYRIKEVKRYQQAEPNEPVDAFELASRNFPIIGFTKTSDLKKQFEVKLIPQGKTEPTEFILLNLKTKPDSFYKDDFTSIDFWIDKKLYLPAKIVAVSTEEDIYQIRFLNPKVNKKLKSGIFDFKISKGFGKPEIIPLKKKPSDKPG